jgi:hypothetical protein
MCGLLCSVPVNSYFSKHCNIGAAGTVFWNILAGIVVVLWNSSVVCSPRYSVTGLCGRRHRDLQLVRYAAFVHLQSVGACHLFCCFRFTLRKMKCVGIF